MSVEVNTYKTYLAMIENSAGTRMFRNVYASVDGEEQEILRDGELACAYFVSGVLRMFDLCNEMHVTVRRLLRDMESSGWIQRKDPPPGAVVYWKERTYDDGEQHEHIGFLVGDEEAVSTDYRKCEVVRHPLTELNGKREVKAVYWHPKLGE